MPEAGKDLEVNVSEVKDKIYIVVTVGGLGDVPLVLPRPPAQ